MKWGEVMNENTVNLNKRQRHIIVTQLEARADYFREDLKRAASRDDFSRVSECSKVLQEIQEIQGLMIDVKGWS